MRLKLFLGGLIGALSACAEPPPPQNIQEAEPPRPLVLTFVGDIMANPLMTGLIEKDPKALEPVKPYLDGDFNFANLEFTVDVRQPPMGYPKFNGTRAYLSYFKDYFNMVSVANNHVYDHGALSQAETLEYLQEDGILPIGGSTNAPYTPALRTNIRGVDLFFNAFSLLDNMLAYRATNTEHRYYMNFFSQAEEAALALAQELEGVPAETLKIVSLHFGREYTPEPTPAEKRIPRLLIEAGADIVVGHHPHVPRPAQWYEGTNHSGVILYSLGNFYTPHKNSYSYLDAGTIVRLEASPQKEYRFSYIPTFTYFDQPRSFSRVFPLENPPHESIPEGYVFSDRDRLNMENAYEIVHRFYQPLLSIERGR